MAYGSTSNLSMDASRPLKICLFGITGCGKSALGNVLLGYGPDGDTQGFRTSNSPTGPDSDVVVIEGSLFGDVNRRVCIIDTPGCGKEEAEDKRSMNKIVEALRREETVDAFVWVKNSQQPRYDLQEAEFFSMLLETIGPGLFQNLIVVFSRWSFGEKEEQRRKRNRSALTLDAMMRELWDSFVQHHEECKEASMVPMMALDSFYDPEDEREAAMFNTAVKSLWENAVSFEPVKLTRIKAGLTRAERLEDEIRKLRDGRRRTQGIILAFGAGSVALALTITVIIVSVRAPISHSHETETFVALTVFVLVMAAFFILICRMAFKPHNATGRYRLLGSEDPNEEQAPTS